MKRLLMLAALGAAVAGPARAHEIECQKGVGLLKLDGYGHVVLDGYGVPVFSSAPSAILALDAYPAIVGWRLEVDNLASVPSIVTGVEDRFFAACSARVYGDVHAPPLTVPPSGILAGVVAVRVGSYEECLALGGERDDEHEGGVCREVVDNTLVLTTESNVAQCRARLVCRHPRPGCEGDGHGKGDDDHGHGKCDDHGHCKGDDDHGHGKCDDDHGHCKGDDDHRHGDDGHGHRDDGRGDDDHGKGDDRHGKGDDRHGKGDDRHGHEGHSDDGDVCPSWASGHSRRWGT